MSQSDLAPALLVAMPQLLDPNFHRSVVMMVEHDERGAFGLVLNRTTDLAISDLCEGLEMEWHGAHDAVVRWGGPVSPERGWVLIGEGGVDHVAVESVMPGIRFTRSPEALREIALDPPSDTRLYLGYAGWGPGQLEAELLQGAWIVAPPSSDLIFGVRDEALWEAVMRDLGIDPATLVPTQGVN